MGKKGLDLIIEAIVDAKEITRVGHDVKVYIRSANQLVSIYPEEIYEILLKLQDDEKIIKVKTFPHERSYINRDTWNRLWGYGQLYFSVEILEPFDKWYIDCQVKKGQPMEGLLHPQGRKVISTPKPDFGDVVLKGPQIIKPEIQANKQEPTPVSIVQMPELIIKGFEEKVVLQKPKDKRIQLHNFPSDLRWEEISIRFLNGHEVIIRARDETLQTNYEQMGFQDEKRKLPNKQWDFLRLLSIKNGEVSWENVRDLPLKQINTIKKQKQLLSEGLKAYFQIHNDEPFHDYKSEKAYRIKLALIPESSREIDEQEVYNE